MAVVAAVCLIGMRWVDLPLALWMHAQTPKGSWPYLIAVNISGFGRGHFYIVPSLICAYVWWRRRNLVRMRASLLITGTWAVSGLSGLFFKHLFGRSRPSQYFAVQEYGFNWLQSDRPHTSFPSGHTTDVFAIATLLWLMFPKWRPVWMVWALLMALSRLVSQNHYLTDTIAAAALGITVAVCMRRGFIRIGWYTANGMR